jgi:hypothetical protein
MRTLWFAGGADHVNDLSEVRAVCSQPLLKRHGKDHGVPLAHHPVSLEEPAEMVKAIGRFGEVTRTMPFQPGGIALEDGTTYLTDGIALPVQPPPKRITGA